MFLDCVNSQVEKSNTRSALTSKFLDGRKGIRFQNSNLENVESIFQTALSEISTTYFLGCYFQERTKRHVRQIGNELQLDGRPRIMSALGAINRKS